MEREAIRAAIGLTTGAFCGVALQLACARLPTSIASAFGSLRCRPPRTSSRGWRSPSSNWRAGAPKKWRTHAAWAELRTAAGALAARVRARQNKGGSFLASSAQRPPTSSPKRRVGKECRPDCGAACAMAMSWGSDDPSREGRQQSYQRVPADGQDVPPGVAHRHGRRDLMSVSDAPWQMTTRSPKAGSSWKGNWPRLCDGW